MTRENFWDSVDKRGPTECWPWLGGRSWGYGGVDFEGRSCRAHRVAFFLANGYWAMPMTLHRCKNSKLCCNPSHLYEGDAKMNSEDARRDGVLPVGERNGSHTKPERLPRGERHGSRTKPHRLARGDKNGANTCPERLCRGDTHYSRLHPEKLARGKRHGSQTRPECSPRGEQHGCAKLTGASVEYIRARYAAGEVTQQRLADLFGVHRSTISLIVRNKKWKETANG